MGLSVARLPLVQNPPLKKTFHMKKLTFIAAGTFLLLSGVYFWLLKDNQNQAVSFPPQNELHSSDKKSAGSGPASTSIMSPQNSRKLDKIGAVINEKNAFLNEEVKNQIKKDRKIYDQKRDLKEKEVMLEQSFFDRSSTAGDTKKIQEQIIDLKTKLDSPLKNTERWDPKFVFYLMIQENYTYGEINQIKSLTENGISPEEVNFINDLIKQASFNEKIVAFKNHEGFSRAIASTSKKKREKDEFIEDSGEHVSLESKLIEMNYNQDEKDEMVYGHSQH